MIEKVNNLVESIKNSIMRFYYDRKLYVIKEKIDTLMKKQ